MKLSPDSVRTLLTSVFPSDFIDDRARECGVVEWDRDIDIRMFVWTLAVGFAWSYAQLILMELADFHGLPPPNIPELLYQEAKQSSPGRRTLLEEVCSDLTAAGA